MLVRSGAGRQSAIPNSGGESARGNQDERELDRNMSVKKLPKRLALCAVLVASLSSGASASLDALAGRWSGEGSMKPSDGPFEKVRCKVAYDVKTPGRSIKLDLKCASEAYKMVLSANIEEDGNSLSGDWFESEYRQGGKIYGTDSGDLIEARIEGATAAALVTIRTRGRRQSFAMDAPGAWLSQVQIELTKDQQ